MAKNQMKPIIILTLNSISRFFAVFCDFSTFGQVIDSKRKKVLESTEKLVYNIDILTKKRKNHYEK
jgi:hypothetical protein